MDDGLAPILCRSVEATCERLGPDGSAYHRVIDPFVRHWPELSREILQPPHIPRNPWLLARFGYQALWPAALTARRLFQTESARALFAGIAAHSILPLESFGSAAFGWVLAITAHTGGWPIPQGGAQRIADALGSYFESLGGQIIVNTRISSLRELDSTALLLFDLTPKPFLEIAGNELPKGFRHALSRYRYGPGAFKMDWALSEPIPWRAPDCLRAGTVHVGGTLDEIAWGEREAAEGEVVSRPFVLVAQPTLFDPSRAPAGQHIAWAYCHVPNKSDADMTAAIEAQIERFAPGFRQRILARHVLSPAGLERWNANLVGGDIVGGAQDLRQLLIRPTRRLYRTPLDNVYLCSSSTPPGGGVHGMCGYWAAHAALADAGMKPASRA
jgi:phytoene dehydrogenase-like protein